MNFAWPCHECIESLHQITVEWEHVYVKHSYRTDVDDVSLFLPNISLRRVFNTFLADLQDGNLREEIDSRHGPIRLVYHVLFNSIVGTFPDPSRRRRGGRIIHYETCFVKVVCDSSRCLLCGRRLPRVVVTMFPHEDRN